MVEVSECAHGGMVMRIRALYVDGRPLYRCDNCDARLVYEDDEQTYKALVESIGVETCDVRTRACCTELELMP